MTTNCLPVPITTSHQTARTVGIATRLGHRLARTAAYLGRRVAVERTTMSEVAMSEHVLSEIDVPRDLHR